MPIPTSSPASSEITQSTSRCAHSTLPLTQPANVTTAIDSESSAIAPSGGRPPRTRHAIPTSIAPEAIVTPAIGSPAAIGIPSTATTGIAAIRPADHETAWRSKFDALSRLSVSELRCREALM